jgi:hypothetical protein
MINNTSIYIYFDSGATSHNRDINIFSFLKLQWQQGSQNEAPQIDQSRTLYLTGVGNTDKKQTVILCKYSFKILNIGNNPMLVELIMVPGDRSIYILSDRCILYRHSGE